jgi:hypothetical protein
MTTNQGNTPNKVPVEQWLAIRREEALRIDVETAEVTWTYAQTFDPYGVEGVPEELKQIGREYFARSPGSKVWVWFGDLPHTVVAALWEKHSSQCSDALPGPG